MGSAFTNAVGNERTHGRAYNLTSDEWLPWNAYHRKVAAAIGAPEPEIVQVPAELLRSIAPDRGWVLVINLGFSNVFDNSAAKADLGFAPGISFKDGVRRVAAWLDERGKIDGAPDDPLVDEVIQIWRRHAEDITGELRRTKQRRA